jgi:ClpP class serine protease
LGEDVFDAVDDTVMVAATVAGLVLVIVGFMLSRVMQAQQAETDERQVARLRSKRRSKYDEAKKDYFRFRKKIESGNTVLVDFIHDLGDDFVGRDSAQQQIAFDEAFEAVAAIRQANARTKVVVVLHTLGGYARPAHMIALALKRHLKNAKRHNTFKDPRVTAYIPYVAMSGGTMIALASELVCMDETASLGPIDTIYGGFPTEAYEALLDQKGALATQDVLVMLAHEAKKYDRYAAKVAREIVNDAHKSKSKDEHYLADYLSEGKMSHSQAISVGEAKGLGMNVSSKVPNLIYGLVDARIRMINTRLEFEEDRLANPEDDKGGTDTPEKAMQRAIHQSLDGGLGR